MQDGGTDCPRVDGTAEKNQHKKTGTELKMGCAHVVHLAGPGSSAEETKKLVLQLFRADPCRAAWALNE